jgi:hypothetical protein
MINHPVTFHRNYNNDFPDSREKQPKSIYERCQSIAIAALPLLALYRPLRGPLTAGLSCIRMATHAQQMVAHFKQGHFNETAFHFLHTTLAIGTLAL